MPCELRRLVRKNIVSAAGAANQPDETGQELGIFAS
jgi:hypothetical protein